MRVDADGERQVVSVQDGPGIDPADRDEAFRRGTSGDGGTGIGLHMARALADADGATLQVARGSPARFELRFGSRIAPER